MAQSTMKAWLFSSAAGGLEKNLVLEEHARSVPPLKPFQIKVEVLSASVNPIDYKIPEIPIVGSWLIKKPASPGKDFAGRVVLPDGGEKVGFKHGDRVFGRFEGMPSQYGVFAQYVNASLKGGLAKLPEGVSFEDGAALGTAGVSAVQSLASVGREEGSAKGKTVLINGASGGVGTFTVQVAKTMGAKVVATCSGANAQLVKDLGADEIIDYRTTDLLAELRQPARAEQFDLIVDNVGTSGLHKAGDLCLKPTGSVVQVGGGTSFAAALSMAKSALWPAFLGGAKRPWKFLGAADVKEDLDLVARWVKEGKVKVVVDSTFAFEDAPKAYERLKTGRARGKIVVSSFSS